MGLAIILGIAGATLLTGAIINWRESRRKVYPELVFCILREENLKGIGKKVGRIKGVYEYGTNLLPRHLAATLIVRFNGDIDTREEIITAVLNYKQN